MFKFGHKKEIPMQYIPIFPRVGYVVSLPHYSNNEIYCQELRIALSPHDWSEFEKQDVFRELLQYFDSKGIQKDLTFPREGEDLQEGENYKIFL